MAGGACVLRADRCRGRGGAGPPVTPPVETVLITGNVYRDRSTAIAPTLEYGLDYFQRFEPLTVGDMLKRVPSVAFVSDVLEYDGVRLRGLDPGYTQILINGEKVPGAGDDRSFFVDRIPAELIERVEIVRSASRQPLRRRRGRRAQHRAARRLRVRRRLCARRRAVFRRRRDQAGLGGVCPAARSAAARLLGGVNVQGRHNPKEKRSYRFEDPGRRLRIRQPRGPDRRARRHRLFGQRRSIRSRRHGRICDCPASVVHTDRTETEHLARVRGHDQRRPRRPASPVADQLEDITQDNFALGARTDADDARRRDRASARLSRFKDETSSPPKRKREYDPFPDARRFRRHAHRSPTRTTRNGRRGFTHKRTLQAWSMLEFGVDYADKERDGACRGSGDRRRRAMPFPRSGADRRRVLSRSRRRALDPYVQFSGDGGILAWEAGPALRDDRLQDRRPRRPATTAATDYNFLLPSAHASST